MTKDKSMTSYTPKTDTVVEREAFGWFHELRGDDGKLTGVFLGSKFRHAAESVASDEKTHVFPLYRSIVIDDALREENERLREGIENAIAWHEMQDKALSKQPPSSGPNGTKWARAKHQQQIEELRAAINGNAS